MGATPSQYLSMVESHWSHLCSQLGHQASNCTNHEWLVHVLLQESSSAVTYTSKNSSGDNPLKQTQSSFSVAKSRPWARVQRKWSKEALNFLVREGPECLCSAHHLVILQILSLNELISISHYKSPKHVPRKNYTSSLWWISDAFYHFFNNYSSI